jgi:hypothetical protein
MDKAFMHRVNRDVNNWSILWWWAYEQCDKVTVIPLALVQMLSSMTIT